MLRAQVEQFVYNAPAPWWTLGTGLGAAVLAGIFATIGWYVVHKNSRNRDLENWRRTILVEATTDLVVKDIELHTGVAAYLYDYDDSHSRERWKELQDKTINLRSYGIKFEISKSKHVAIIAAELSEHYRILINELPRPSALDDTTIDERNRIFKNRHNQKPDMSKLQILLNKDLAD
ncbi:hypothetical protein BH92_15415 [Rhodococcoides fascians A21d2]|uniref:hypothetical protein n=1 Tax=Rhodococcoides fascians TaxID=1828 RepID=UPI00056575B4|nr:hypothetical protein [Rhodococcus fascians]QII01078.1 hypothetical protein BH92_15415 [Rhodococcus fascians A21d2]